jgi:hypothetical protein
MYRLSLFVLIILFEIIGLPPNCNAQFNLKWEQKLNKKNIEIYSAKMPKAGLNAVKAHSTFKVSGNDIVNYLLSTERQIKDIPNCVYSKILKQEGDSVFIFYQKYDLPWPISDRDIVYKVVITKTASSIIVNSEVIPNYLPINPHFIRVKELVAHWDLTNKPGNITDACYMVIANPAGSIPAWFLNLFLVDGPYNSFKLMHAHFDEKK